MKKERPDPGGLKARDYGAFPKVRFYAEPTKQQQRMNWYASLHKARTIGRVNRRARRRARERAA